MLKYDIVSIDKIVNELLSKYDKPYYYTSLDPSVDIIKMAEAYGLIVNPFQIVSSKKRFFFFEADGPYTHGSIKKKHAVIEFDGTVGINRRDMNSEEQCRFNIAHELAHILLNHIRLPDKATIEKYREVKQSFSDCGINVALAARDDHPHLISKIFASFKNRIKEEEADHLAANLLVPIYRFQFWEDKKDEEIAKAFKVELKCIRKRRNEIKDELNGLKATIIQEIGVPDADKLGVVV
jgi:Zn-dependent peptidase ImmA (M78 family)